MSVVETTVKLADLVEHPDNPRTIDTKKLEQLKTSLTTFPEMLEARPLVVNQNNEVIGGNQRFKVLSEVGSPTDDIRVKVVDWSEDKQREFMTKDNTNKGEWDYAELFNKWETEDLSNWGVSVGAWNPTLQPDSDTQDITERDVEKSQSDIANKFTDTERPYLTIKCSNCHEEYFVEDK